MENFTEERKQRGVRQDTQGKPETRSVSRTFAFFPTEAGLHSAPAYSYVWESSPAWPHLRSFRGASQPFFSVKTLKLLTFTIYLLFLSVQTKDNISRAFQISLR